jgi:hypothetical protein
MWLRRSPTWYARAGAASLSRKAQIAYAVATLVGVFWQWRRRKAAMRHAESQQAS